MMEKKNIEKTEFTKSTTAKQVLGLSAKVISLLLLILFLSGHEKANPVLGDSDVEFYCAEFRQGIILFTPVSSVESYMGKRVNQFYQGRNYFPVWTVNFQMNSNYQELKELLASADEYGLFPDTYQYRLLLNQEENLLQANTDSARIRARIAIEQTATRSAMLFMEHIALGIRKHDTSYFYQKFIDRLPEQLNELANDNQLEEGILAMQPDSRMYTRLQKALARYVKKAKTDTTRFNTQILATDTARIHSRLAVLGFTSACMAENVKGFQEAHALDTSGNLDKKTLEQLSIGFKDRFYRLALNMDRLRKIDIAEARAVNVNIPEFKLRYHKENGDECVFKVMVGKPHTPTPELNSKINQVVANPYWTVTRNITRYEMLPRIKKDPDFLQRNGFSVLNNDFEEVAIESIDWENIKASEFDYWLRQNNRKNALGVVKFLFPNDYRVYLHDTQSKRLFAKKHRAYSHGCVRVQNPEQLAQMLLNEDGSSMDINKLIRSGEHKEIRMNKPVSVAIHYFTCTADSLGTISFHPDIYAKDGQAIEQLFGDSSWN